MMNGLEDNTCFFVTEVLLCYVIPVGFHVPSLSLIVDITWVIPWLTGLAYQGTVPAANPSECHPTVPEG